jgi:hypothetical protein
MLSAATSGRISACVLAVCLQAHKAPLAAMAWSHDGAFLATASTTGTVIR